MTILCYDQSMIQKKKILQEIKKSEEQRTEFISIVSHQLRTPLSIVRGYLEALLSEDQGKLTPPQAEYLSDALRINSNMIDLINDYLNAAQLEDNTITVHAKAADFGELIDEVVQSMIPFAKASNCELRYDKPKEKFPKAKIDTIKLTQVIENIISNAIKYTGKGGTITTSLRNDENYITFVCKDTGLGIPKDQQPEIFTRFFRGRNVLGRDTQGSGLGLHTSKAVVTASRGKIWFESEEGKGTTMFVSVPVATTS